MPKVQLPLSTVAVSLQHNAASYGELATALSDRIAGFEQWLLALPGKFEIRFWDKIVGGDEHLGLHFCRDGSHWKLLYCIVTLQQGSMTDAELSQALDRVALKSGTWLPLNQASIPTKIAVVDALPDFLRAMNNDAASRTASLADAHRRLDVIAERIGLPKVGGK